MKRYLDPALWCIAVLTLALVWQLMINRRLRADSNDAAQLAEQAYQQLVADSQARQHSLQQQVDQVAEQFRKEQQLEQLRQNRLISQLRSGAVRLSVAVSDCNQSPAGTDPALAGGTAATRAELTAEAAADLTAIAIDGDNAIRELNACIATYQQIREQMNVQTR